MIIFLSLSFLINLSRLGTAVEWCVNFRVWAPQRTTRRLYRGDVSEFGMKSEGAKTWTPASKGGRWLGMNQEARYQKC